MANVAYAVCEKNYYPDENGECVRCPNNMYSFYGATSVLDCGHIFHAGKYDVYLNKNFQTWPMLCEGTVDDKYCVSLVRGMGGPVHFEFDGQVWSVPEHVMPAESVVFDGNSYIDLGFRATRDLNWEIRAKMDTSVLGRDGALMGARNNSMDKQYVVWFNTWHGEPTLAVRLFIDYTIGFVSEYLTDSIVTLRWDNQVFTMDGIPRDIPYYIQNVYETPVDIVLGGMREVGGIDRRLFLGDIYYARFWNSDGVIMDLTSAVDADGVPCMFDAVSGVCLHLQQY